MFNPHDPQQRRHFLTFNLSLAARQPAERCNAFVSTAGRQPAASELLFDKQTMQNVLEMRKKSEINKYFNSCSLFFVSLRAYTG